MNKPNNDNVGMNKPNNDNVGMNKANNNNVLFNALKTVISDHQNIGFQYIKPTGVL